MLATHAPSSPCPVAALDALRTARAAAYPETDPRLAPLRADLARRLRPALQAAGVALAAPAFDALVLDMARVALRWSDPEVARRVERPSRDTPPEAAAALLTLYPDAAIRAYPVSTWVNAPTHDDPTVLDPLPPDPST